MCQGSEQKCKCHCVQIQKYASGFVPDNFLPKNPLEKTKTDIKLPVKIQSILEVKSLCKFKIPL